MTAAKVLYESEEILSAPPQMLTLMLYDGAIGFLSDGVDALASGQTGEFQTYNQKAQNIIRELMVTLDMKYDLAKQLMALYDYMEYRLNNAREQNIADPLVEVRKLMSELREAWAQAAATI